MKNNQELDQEKKRGNRRARKTPTNMRPKYSAQHAPSPFLFPFGPAVCFLTRFAQRSFLPPNRGPSSYFFPFCLHRPNWQTSPDSLSFFPSHLISSCARHMTSSAPFWSSSPFHHGQNSNEQGHETEQSHSRSPSRYTLSLLTIY